MSNIPSNDAARPACWASANVIPLRGLADNYPCILTAMECAANTVALYTATDYDKLREEVERLRALVAAGNRLDSAMDMQEQRESGAFHLSQQAAAGVWKDARRVWAEAVKKALSAGETVECGGCAPPAIAAAAPAAPTVLANGGMVRAPSVIHEKDVTGTFKPHSLAYAAGWNDCRQAILAAPAAEVDEARQYVQVGEVFVDKYRNGEWMLGWTVEDPDDYPPGTPVFALTAALGREDVRS